MAMKLTFLVILAGAFGATLLQAGDKNRVEVSASSINRCGITSRAGTEG